MIRAAWTGILILLLSACNAGVKPTQPVDANAGKVSLVNFNLNFQQKLKQNASMVTRDNLANAALIRNHALTFSDETRIANLFGENWANIFRASIAANYSAKGMSEWVYMYSEPLPDTEIMQAYYNVEQGDSVQYVTFYFYGEERRLIDVKYTSNTYSVVEFMVQFAESFHKVELLYGEDVLRNYKNFIAANRKGILKLAVENFEALPRVVQTEPVVADLIEKSHNNYSSEDYIEINRVLNSVLLDAGIYRAGQYDIFIEKNDFDNARKAMATLPLYAQEDWLMLSELAIQYAERGEPGKALDLSHRAILSSPDKFLPYWMLTHVSMKLGKLELATQGLKVMETKFGVEINDELMRELDEDGRYVASTAYNDWKKSRRNS